MSMRHDDTPGLGLLAEALDRDIRVRRFTRGDTPGAGPFLDVELERDEPAAELRRRLARLAPVEVEELPAPRSGRAPPRRARGARPGSSRSSARPPRPPTSTGNAW
ncbi:hypothetical protein ACFQ60_39590 [Streptomyces zhihengii]